MVERMATALEIALAALKHHTEMTRRVLLTEFAIEKLEEVLKKYNESQKMEEQSLKSERSEATERSLGN